MPHITVEYSANMAGRVDIGGLLKSLHETALETGVFSIGAVRTRGVRRDEYVISQGALDNGFIHVMCRVGAGRDAETRRLVGRRLFDVLCEYLSADYERSPLAISLEVQEIDADFSFRKNNLHERAKASSIPHVRP